METCIKGDKAKNSATFYKMDKAVLPMGLMHRTHLMFILSRPFTKMVTGLKDFQINSYSIFE
jgi:hypothetical protein